MAITLTTPIERARLDIRDRPYFVRVSDSLHLGYKKGKSVSRWIVRWRVRSGYVSRTIIGAVPDDQVPANNSSVLSYEQALARAMGMNIASIDPRQPKQCGFCGNVQSQVRVLVAGASTYICDACINRSVEILSDTEPSETEGGMLEVLLNPGIEFRIASQGLARLLDQTAFAMGDQDQLPFNGLLLEIEGNRLRAVATNGHHLAVAETAMSCPQQTTQHMILARDPVRELRRALDAVDGDLAVSVKDNCFRVEWEQVACSVELLLGKYPNYRTVVPDHADSIVVDRNELLLSTNPDKRSPTQPLHLALSEESLAISSGPDTDTCKHIDVCYQGPDVRGRFMPDYLNGPLGALQGRFVRLSFNPGHPAWRIEAPDDDSAVYVVMSSSQHGAQ